MAEPARKLRWFSLIVLPALPASGIILGQSSTQPPPLESYQEKTIGISVNPTDGTYTIFDPASKKPILNSRVAAEVDQHWL